MAENALERLYAESLSMDEQKYTADDLLDAEGEDNFIEKMSTESKDFLMSKIQKVELDEVPIEDKEFSSIDDFIDGDTVEEDEDDEQTGVVEEPKRGRGRPRKTPIEDETPSNKVPTVKVSNLDSFMDSLAKDLIEELRVSNYKTRNFSQEQMLVILNYLEEKI